MNEAERKRVGERIRLAREAMELSQQELAARAAVEQRQVSYIERGALNARWDTYSKIAAALGSTVHDLTAP